MSKVLSQEEIDALFSAMAADAPEAQKPREVAAAQLSLPLDCGLPGGEPVQPGDGGSIEASGADGSPTVQRRLLKSQGMRRTETPARTGF